VQDTPPGICPKFADDLASHGVGKDVSVVQGILQKSLDDLNIWSEQWDMMLNVSKTKFMQQAEYAASNASKACKACKENRLIDGRDGVSLSY